MTRRPTRSTRTDTRFPSTTLFRSKFDAIETGGAGIARAGPVGLDEIGDLRGFESARRLERDLAPGRVEMIAGRGNRRRCDGERASRLETRMRDAADMPKMEEDGAAFRMDRGCHLAPALALPRGIDSGRREMSFPRQIGRAPWKEK